ncbi:MAG: YqgE/AlgH family protein [Flavobacteriaceae bacterium]|jgi:putative transcriptional regulator|nr:YqgE/AlgH family protein [Flavobacteriaceae bacterium]
MSKNNNTIKLTTGTFFASLPSRITDDLLFSRTVLLLVEHNENETLGFILNKPSPFILNQLIKETCASFTVYYGGPVEQDNLFCIHQRPDLIPDSKYIEDGLYWGGDFETIFDLINRNEINKNDIRFFLGYAGWGANQLLEEFSNLFWKKIKSIPPDELFKLSSDASWKNSIEELGENYRLYSNAPLDPTFN